LRQAQAPGGVVSSSVLLICSDAGGVGSSVAELAEATEKPITSKNTTIVFFYQVDQKIFH
jgi:hypothetical protein